MVSSEIKIAGFKWGEGKLTCAWADACDDSVERFGSHYNDWSDLLFKTKSDGGKILILSDLVFLI